MGARSWWDQVRKRPEWMPVGAHRAGGGSLGAGKLKLVDVVSDA